MFIPTLIFNARGFSSIIVPAVYAVPTVPPYSRITLILELNLSILTTKSFSVDIPITSVGCKTSTSPFIGINVTIPVLPVLPIPVETLKVAVVTPIV